MSWYGREETPAAKEAAANRKEADRLNAENRKRKEALASGYGCVTRL